MEHHVIIVDCNHMLHTFYNGMQNRLSIRVQNPDGTYSEKDTTIQNGMIKNIFRWSKCGNLPTALCFDRPCPSRKAFFRENFSVAGAVKGGGEYKGHRESMNGGMFVASRDVFEVFRSAGASCYAIDGYEADDLIMACVERARVKYPGMHIDVITNDADMLPLVSEDVSVYIRSKRGTYAKDKDYEKNHYIEITPENFEEQVGFMSAYKGFKMPYNTILLHKMLRGDSSDEFGLKDVSKLFSPVRWNAMIERMEADGVDFGSIFRYGKPVVKIMNRITGEEFQGTMQEALNSPDKANLYQKICDPRELEGILDVLLRYKGDELTAGMIERLSKVYWGMNLNMVYPNSDKAFARRAVSVDDFGKFDMPDISTYSEPQLRSVANKLFSINLR